MGPGINRKKVRAYCGYELDRLVRSNHGVCSMYAQIAPVARDPALRGALEDLMETNQELVHLLHDCCDRLDHEVRTGKDPALNALLASTLEALDIEDPDVRDLVLATSSLRCLHWTLASTASLASLWRYLDCPQEALELERFVFRLTGAREQLQWMFDSLLRRGLGNATPAVVQRHQIPTPTI